MGAKRPHVTSWRAPPALAGPEVVRRTSGEWDVLQHMQERTDNGGVRMFWRYVSGPYDTREEAEAAL